MDEFIRKLSVETPLSFDEASRLVSDIIYLGGKLETIKTIYEVHGVYRLRMYLHYLKLGVYH